ncbi:MAG: transglycosylase domain-containing protein [Candidatus Fimimonas sp.]
MLKIVSITLCALVLLGCLGALFWVRKLQNGTSYVKFDKAKLTEVCSNVKILDDDGEEIKEALYFNDNKQIPLSALHDYTYQAFVAVEDKRFFSHHGVDAKRVLGALAHNLQSGNFKEGASTISQQLIKNTHLDNTKSIKRKVNEMLLALELENNYTKEEILEMYLNTIYFGRSAYGIESAANVYFNKSASNLSIAESATLAGMIKAPNNYAPDKNPQKSRKRRDLVLKLMLEQGVITKKQFDEAISSEIVYRPYHAVAEKSYVQQVIDEACKLLNMTQAQLFRSGFVIETYFDKNVQNALNEAVAKDGTKNADGSLADLSCVFCTNDGGIAACYFRGESALRSKQIGSTAKPIAVYTPALCEKLITQASPVLDEPTSFGGYTPANASGYNGWTTVKTAVTKSLNVPAVKTLNSLGLNTAEKYLAKLGFSGEQNLSLALGNINGGMTAKQLATCYATLANDGICNEACYVKSIYSENGEIYKRTSKNVRVYDSRSTFLMTDMLENAVNCGTARLLKNARIQIAAKTGTVGTSEGNTEAIVAGYTTKHTFVVWYSGKFANSVNGSTAPCKLAAQTLTKMYKTAPKNFCAPQGIVKLTVDKNELYNNQEVKLSENGEKFLFDAANKPSEKKSEIKPQFDYRLSVRQVNGEWAFDLPTVFNCSWKIFKVEGGKEIAFNKQKPTNGVYCAKLFEDQKCVYTTPKISVTLPKDENQEKNFWDYRFLPHFGK